MGKNQRRNYGAVIIAGIAVGVGIFTVLNQPQQAQACGTSQGAIVGGPSVGAQTVQWEFQKSGSPAELKDINLANHIIDLSNQYQIDDAFALGLWNAEDNEGTTVVAKHTKNIGNMLYSSDLAGASPYYDPNGYVYAAWPMWRQGIDAWFQQAQYYVVNKGLTDWTTFSLYYAHGILTHNPTQAQKDLVAGYVSNIQRTVDDLDQHEASLHSQATGGGGNHSFSVQIPDGAWATPAARRDAQKLGLFNCGDTHTLVGAAMTLALHLTFNACSGGEWCGLFNRWDGTIPDPPAEIDRGTGVVQCVSFVKSVYRMATGKDVPFAHNAVDWWSDYKNVPGFKEYPVANGPPQPGDFIVYENVDSNGNPTGGAGHIAVVVGVQLPQAGQDGFIIIAQGNATNVLAEQSLSQRGTIWYLGRYDPLEVALGYIRVTSQ